MKEEEEEEWVTEIMVESQHYNVLSYTGNAMSLERIKANEEGTPNVPNSSQNMTNTNKEVTSLGKEVNSKIGEKSEKEKRERRERRHRHVKSGRTKQAKGNKTENAAQLYYPPKTTTALGSSFSSGTSKKCSIFSFECTSNFKQFLVTTSLTVVVLGLIIPLYFYTSQYYAVFCRINSTARLAYHVSTQLRVLFHFMFVVGFPYLISCAPSSSSDAPSKPSGKSQGYQSDPEKKKSKKNK